MITEKFDNGTLEICINRSDKRNALSHDMYQQLEGLFRSYGNIDSCTSIIIYGAGNCFTAGADLNDFNVKREPGDSPAVKFLRALSNSTTPVIAAVEGFAVGIGTTLLQHCDFIYATEDTRFRLPFVALGLCPEGGSSFLLEHIVGRTKARDWLLTARFFSGKEAHEAGLVTEIVGKGVTLERARATARLLNGLPKHSVQLTKSMLDGRSRRQVHSAFDDEVHAFAELLSSTETKKSIYAMGKAKN